MASEPQRVAIVTGSANGMGVDIALSLANDGFDLALFDLPRAEANLHSVAEKVKQKGRKAITVTGDISIEKDVENLIQTTVDQLGSVDVMIANAGIVVVGSFLEATVQDFEKIFSVNVRGTYLCFQYAARQMIKQGRGGRLIAASSIAGLAGEQFVSFYSSTKFAIRGLVLSLAKELGSHGITVNAYAPGAVSDTTMFTETKSKMAKVFGFPDPDAFNDLEKQFTPLGYLAKGEDIANAVSFLSKKESHFITGQTLSVNGGRYVF